VPGGQVTPVFIEVAGDSVYWTQAASNFVHQVSKSGGSAIDAYTENRRLYGFLPREDGRLYIAAEYTNMTTRGVEIGYVEPGAPNYMIQMWLDLSSGSSFNRSNLALYGDALWGQTWGGGIVKLSPADSTAEAEHFGGGATIADGDLVGFRVAGEFTYQLYYAEPTPSTEEGLRFSFERVPLDGSSSEGLADVGTSEAPEINSALGDMQSAAGTAVWIPPSSTGPLYSVDLQTMDSITTVGIEDIPSENEPIAGMTRMGSLRQMADDDSYVYWTEQVQPAPGERTRHQIVRYDPATRTKLVLGLAPYEHTLSGLAVDDTHVYTAVLEFGGLDGYIAKFPK
jgi:hypothetical protein